MVKIFGRSAPAKNKTLALLALATLLPTSIFAGAVSGTVKDATDTTIHVAGAKVVIITSGVRTDSVFADPSGNYTFANLTAGARQRQTSATRYVTTGNTNFTVPATDTSGIVINLTPVSINGTVRYGADTSQRVAGAKVVLILGTTRTDSATTSSTGTYSIRRVAPGIGSLQISDSGYTSQTIADTVAAVSITKNFILQPVTVSGTVKRSTDTTQHVPGAKIVLIGTAGRLDSTTTDSAGNYSFFRVKPGSMTVEASATGFVAATSASFTVAQANIIGQVVALSAPTAISISGNVINNLGEPLGNVLITLKLESAPTVIVDTVRTNAAGVYSIPNVLTPYLYIISASRTGYITKTNTGVLIDSSADHGFDGSGFVLAFAPGTISGLLTYAVTADVIQPIRDANVTLRRGSESGSLVATTTTNSNGVYSFANVLPGSPNYWITVNTTLGSMTNSDVVVSQGGSATSNFNFVAAALRPGISGSQDIRFVRVGDRLLVQLNSSKVARTLEVYDVKGTVYAQLPIPAGETRAVIPASMIPGNDALFRVK